MATKIIPHTLDDLWVSLAPCLQGHEPRPALPEEGSCPACGQASTWADALRRSGSQGWTQTRPKGGRRKRGALKADPKAKCAPARMQVAAIPWHRSKGCTVAVQMNETALHCCPAQSYPVYMVDASASDMHPH